MLIQDILPPQQVMILKELHTGAPTKPSARHQHKIKVR